MGEIWLAEDGDLGRPVALKKIRGNPNDATKDQFLREAQVTGQLEHPGVVPIHELGRDEAGQPFYAMKFIQGRTLTEVIDEFHASPPRGDVPREVQGLRLLQFFLHVCQTMAYAHSRGVIHRDLKPDNVMVGAYGETLVLDWGLAKPMGVPEEPGTGVQIRNSFSGETLETQAGTIKGTGAYMSPEVAEGRVEAVDHVSDVFLLGGILYHILTGKKPRQARKLPELILMASTQTPTVPRKLNPAIPKDLDAICMKALALRKEDRYQSAAALAEDVQRHLAGEPVLAYRENAWERLLRWAKRHRVALLRAAVAVAFLGLLGFGVNEYLQARARHEQELQDLQDAQDQELREASIRNALKVRKAKVEQEKAEREAANLAARQKAGQDLQAFRRLANETQLYAAFQDPGAEHMPYYDPEKGATTAREALAVVGPYGPRLEQFPLAEDRAAFAAELYDLLLLVTYTTGRRAGATGVAGETVGKEMLALLDRAEPLRPTTVGYHRLRGAAYQLLGDRDRAATEEHRAGDPNTPTRAVDHFLTAERYRTQHDPREEDQGKPAGQSAARKRLIQAIEYYRKALALEQGHFWSHFQLGQCYLALGQGDLAVEALGACVALRPKLPWGYTLRGLVLGLQKRYPEALADLNEAVRLDPTLRPARLNRGVVHWLHKQYDAALADFATVLAEPAEQRLLEAAFYRGRLHLERGDVDRALADFSLAVSEKRGPRAAYLRRAVIYFAQGDLDKGLADVESYLTRGGAFDPKSAAGHEARGRQLRLLAAELPGAARKTLRLLAQAELKQAVALGGRNPGLFDQLGLVSQDLNQLPQSAEAYGQAIALSPKEARLRVKRGAVLVDLDRYDEALADFTAALKLEPTHAEAHAWLGYVEACQGKAPAEASRRALEATLHGSGDYLVLHNVACVYGKLSEKAPKRAREYEDLALACLYREVELWRRERKGPDPIPLIRGDSAFPQGLRERPEFKKLIESQD